VTQEWGVEKYRECLLTNARRWYQGRSRDLNRRRKGIMLLEIFTLAHVVISLIGILAGFVVVWGLINAKQLDGWTSLFLWTTVLTSVTGFMFPYHGFQPSYVVGIVSLLVLTAAIYVRYRRHMAGAWRASYVITSVIRCI
jgi:hypothetical protein